jgi:superfamily II DNA or RNA helicase
VNETASPIDLTGLRAWQRAAISQYFRENPQDFMAVATPGAGKTTFALRIASELMQRRIINRIIVVTPTDHLTKQWALAANGHGLNLDSSFTSNKTSAKGFDGIVLTYAGVASNPLRLRVRVDTYKTLVILDEIHHAGDALSWGDAVIEAFATATRRIALTGTPFRSDINPIPFVKYEADSFGVKRSVADYAYNYGDALREGVVRPVLFLAYSGKMKWRTRAGEVEEADVAEENLKDVTARAWRTALNPTGKWIGQVLQAADKRLNEVRRYMPDAAGLVIASDHEHAKAYVEILQSITKDKPVLVLSDDPKAGEKIAKFTHSKARWMVAVRMVSEGVDIPRLAVGVYATNTSTPLFFAQAVGRFVRARQHGETATVFVPSVPILLSHAAEIERQRDHVLGHKAIAGIWDENDAITKFETQERNKFDAEFDELPAFEALDSEATFDKAVMDGGELKSLLEPGSPEEEAILGMPGMLSPEEVSALLAEHRAKQIQFATKKPKEKTLADQLSDLRSELSDVVWAYAQQIESTPMAVHAQLKRSLGGVPAPLASLDELKERIELVRKWALGK